MNQNRHNLRKALNWLNVTMSWIIRQWDAIWHQKTMKRQTNSTAKHVAFYVLILESTKFKPKFLSNSFFTRTAALCKRLPWGCFPDHYNLNLFNSNVNRYLSYMYTQYSHIVSFPVHALITNSFVTLYLKWSLGLKKDLKIKYPYVSGEWLVMICKLSNVASEGANKKKKKHWHGRSDHVI